MHASLGPNIPENFRDAPATAALAPDTVGVSDEQVGVLDEADVLFMTFAAGDDRARFEGNPLVRQLRAVREGCYVPLTLDQAVALQAPGVVSVRRLLDELRPALQEVGEPRSQEKAPHPAGRRFFGERMNRASGMVASVTTPHTRNTSL